MKTVLHHKGFTRVCILLSCLTFTLLGTTIAFSASTIAVSPDPANDFNVVNLGSTSLEQILTIYNSGDSPLDVSSMSMSEGDFFFDPSRGTEPCASSSPVIPPGDSCTMCVVLSPVSEGAKSAVLTIDSNAQNQPSFSINLSGIGSLQQEFNDVSDSNWAEDYIHTLFYNGITSGYGDGTYRPSVSVNRAQMAVYIVRTLEGDPTEECSSDPFIDVPASHWACTYIRRISELGISSGYGDGTYRPGNPVTRAEMAAYIIRALEGDPTEECSSDPFIDVPASHWACNYIKRISDPDMNISSGYSDGTYRPANPVTRAEMAVYITRGFLVFIDNPEIYVSRLYHNFGEVTEGNTSVEQVFTFSNTGTADLDITDISLSGTDSAEFTLDLNGGSTPCGSSSFILNAGDSCTVSTSFRPITSGLKNANLTIGSSDVETPVVNISLSGTGQSILFIDKNGSGAGTVTSTPSGIYCGSDCSETYNSAVTITLSAQTSSGSTFTGWSGDSDCSDSEVTMDVHKNCTATFELQGGGGIIDYINVPLSWNGSKYAGLLYSESIGPKPSQKFYRIDLPPDCTTVLQLWLAGNVGGYINANMIASDQDFNTPSAALGAYNYFIGQYGYDNNQKVFYNNATFWFNFQTSYEGESFYILSPLNTSDTYYIDVVNADNKSGKYNFKAYCW